MLHKCANPACPIPFRKLSQGKLFLVETEPLGVSELRRGGHEASPSHGIEYYRLGAQCAFALTLSYEKGRGVVTVPRPEDTKKRPATAAPAPAVSSNTSSRTEQSASRKARHG